MSWYDGIRGYTSNKEIYLQFLYSTVSRLISDLVEFIVNMPYAAIGNFI